MTTPERISEDSLAHELCDLRNLCRSAGRETLADLIEGHIAAVESELKDAHREKEGWESAAKTQFENNEQFRADIAKLQTELEEAQSWPKAGDLQLSEDHAIKAAFPTQTGRHDLYVQAMRLVGARRSKAGLVALVNWLLYRLDHTQKAYEFARGSVK